MIATANPDDFSGGQATFKSCFFLAVTILTKHSFVYNHLRQGSIGFLEGKSAVLAPNLVGAPSARSGSWRLTHASAILAVFAITCIDPCGLLGGEAAVCIPTHIRLLVCGKSCFVSYACFDLPVDVVNFP